MTDSIRSDLTTGDRKPSIAEVDLGPLKKLENICDEIFEKWDADQRSGKLLMALSGHLPRYRQDATDVRRALETAPDLNAAAMRLLPAAAFIVRACNAYDDNQKLIADMLAALNLCAKVVGAIPIGPNDIGTQEPAYIALCAAENAIARAEGRQP